MAASERLYELWLLYYAQVSPRPRDPASLRRRARPLHLRPVPGRALPCAHVRARPAHESRLA